MLEAQFPIVISEPWDFMLYLHNRNLLANFVGVAGKSWIVKLDRGIYHNGTAASHFLISPRKTAEELSNELPVSGLVISMLPILDQFLESGCIADNSEQAMKQDFYHAAGWSLLATIHNPDAKLNWARCDGFNYYATFADHTQISNAEIGLDFMYVRRSDGKIADAQAYDSMLDIPNLGVSISGRWSGDCNYWIVDASRLKELRSAFISSSRSRLITLDDGLQFTMSGLYQENVMITGYFDYITNNTDIHGMYHQFFKQVKQNFTKIQDCWLGPEALQLFQNGMKFTTSVTGNVSYDLMRP